MTANEDILKGLMKNHLLGLSLTTSLQLSLKHDVFILRSYHLTLPSSPHDKKLFGSPGIERISYTVPKNLNQVMI